MSPRRESTLGECFRQKHGEVRALEMHSNISYYFQAPVKLLTALHLIIPTEAYGTLQTRHGFSSFESVLQMLLRRSQHKTQSFHARACPTLLTSTALRCAPRPREKCIHGSIHQLHILYFWATRTVQCGHPCSQQLYHLKSDPQFLFHFPWNQQ